MVNSTSLHTFSPFLEPPHIKRRRNANKVVLFKSRADLKVRDKVITCCNISTARLDVNHPKSGREDNKMKLNIENYANLGLCEWKR